VHDEDEAVLVERGLLPRPSVISIGKTCWLPLVRRRMLLGPKVSLTSFSPVATV